MRNIVLLILVFAAGIVAGDLLFLMLAIFGLVLGYVNLIGMIVALILVFGVFGLACVGAAVGGAGG